MKTKPAPRPLPAFTLVEMLLVLILSAIVVTIAYAVYTNVRSFNREYEKRTTDATELLSLDMHLRQDAIKTSDLATAPESITFLTEPSTNPTDTTQTAISTYTLNPTGLRRTTPTLTDNFNIPIRAIHSETTPQEKKLILIIGPPDTQPDTFTYTIKPIPTAQISSSSQ